MRNDHGESGGGIGLEQRLIYGLGTKRHWTASKSMDAHCRQTMQQNTKGCCE